MILALDLGSVTGFAFITSTHARFSGSWNFRPKKGASKFTRYTEFVSKIAALHAVEPIVAVFYEEVRRHNGTQAAHVYGGFHAALGAWCAENGVPMKGFEVGAIKKFATGKGNANKQAMILAAEERWGVVGPDDNEADAVAICEMALLEHRELAAKRLPSVSQ